MLNRCIGGRLNRKKYIMYYLATVVVFVFLIMVSVAVLLGSGEADKIEPGGAVYFYSMGIVIVAQVIMVCLGIRRLHDLGKGGRWTLAIILPSVFSFIVYFVDNQIIMNLASALNIAVVMALAVLKGNDGANQFGPAS